MQGPKFDYCIGNPPYQENTQKPGSKTKTTRDIFPEFQKVASAIAHISSMIYPATWQKNMGDGLGKFLKENGLRRCDYYNSTDVFPQIRGNYPLSIPHGERGYGGGIQINGHSRPRGEKIWVDSREKVALVEATKSHDKLRGGAKHLTAASNAQELSEILGITFSKEARAENPISIYIKKKPGSQADGGTYYISQADADTILLPEMRSTALNIYKVATRSRTAGRLPVFNDVLNTVGNLQCRVFAPGEIFSLTWMLLKTFPTAIEAENFKSYANTKFFISLTALDISRASYASWVPDLGDYTAANLLFAKDSDLPHGHRYRGKNLEQRLLLYFNLPEDLWGDFA